MCEVHVGERAVPVCALLTNWILVGGWREVEGDFICQKSSLEMLLVLLFGDMVLLEAT